MNADEIRQYVAEHPDPESWPPEVRSYVLGAMSPAGQHDQAPMPPQEQRPQRAVRPRLAALNAPLARFLAPLPWFIRAALALVAVGALALAGLWVFGAFAPGSGSLTAHGQEDVCVDAPDVTDGSQVTVTDSAGHVIGTGTLATDNSAAARRAEAQQAVLAAGLAQFGGDQTGLTIYDFTVTVPAALPRYGISVGQNRGTVWLSEREMRAGPSVGLGC